MDESANDYLHSLIIPNASYQIWKSGVLEW